LTAHNPAGKPDRKTNCKAFALDVTTYTIYSNAQQYNNKSAYMEAMQEEAVEGRIVQLPLKITSIYNYVGPCCPQHLHLWMTFPAIPDILGFHL
jgi:hypothetical protein